MRTVITADRLFDGTGAEPVDRAVVVFEDGLITAVGQQGQVDEPEGEVNRVAYADCTLLPGLIDCHVHLVFSGGENPLADLLAEDDQALFARAVHNAQTALRAGVTTVKDLGGRGGVTLALRNAINGGILPGTRILAAGPAVTTTGGHCYWLGGEADSVDELRTMVRRLHREGVDLIKVMSSGGRMTAGSNVCAAQYSVPELEALVGEARRLEKTVAAHGHGAAGIRNAVAAGVNIVEHCSWISPENGYEVAFDERVAAQMAEKGIFFDPTLSPGMSRKDVDPATLTAAQRQALEARPRIYEAHRRSVALGVEIASGTDAGVARTPLDSMPGEISHLCEIVGLTPAQAIKAATFNAARSVRKEDEIGSLQVGRRADLIVVPGNPLEDVALVRRTRAVYKDGLLEVEDGRLTRV